MLANSEDLAGRLYRARTRYTLIESQVHEKLEDVSLGISLLLPSNLYYKRGDFKRGEAPLPYPSPSPLKPRKERGIKGVR